MIEGLTLISGHYGSGKSEFAVNLALKMAEKYQSIHLIDLDVVNVAFRVRELTQQLYSKGVHVISTRDNLEGIDIPAISPQVIGLLSDKNARVIVDLGGNPVGATAFAQFTHLIKKRKSSHLHVLNFNRPQTAEPQLALPYLREIEQITDLPVDGLISNTHLLKQTTADDVRHGYERSLALSRETGIQLKRVCFMAGTLSQQEALAYGDLAFPMHLHLRANWMA